MWRESFDWRRKRWLYCFAGQRGPQQANVLKTVPPLEGIRRWLEWNIESQRRIRVEASLHCLSKLVFSGPQDWFWWSSFFPEWRMLHQVVFHLLGVLVLQKGSKILLCIFLKEEPGPCPKAALLLPGLCIPSLPWLAAALGTQGRSWRLRLSP